MLMKKEGVTMKCTLLLLFTGSIIFFMATHTYAASIKRVEKSDEEWKAILTPEQYAITRKKGTEPPFTGAYWDLHEKGIYVCVCCGAKLLGNRKRCSYNSKARSLFGNGTNRNALRPL